MPETIPHNNIRKGVDLTPRSTYAWYFRIENAILSDKLGIPRLPYPARLNTVYFQSEISETCSIFTLFIPETLVI